MEELIFFAVIIFFSIIESIARSRKQKKRQAEQGGELPELPDPSDWTGRAPDLPSPRRDVPTYDEEPSYDDRVRGDTGTRPQPTPSAPSSDVLLPGDLLAELERLAGKKQEQRQARTLEIPKESPPIPTAETIPAPVRRRPPTRVPARPKKARVEHAIHRAHAGYGTDPSSRPRSPHDTLDPLAETLGADAEAVRRQLRSRSASELRQAIILHEVLGPPVALRE